MQEGADTLLMTTPLVKYRLERRPLMNKNRKIVVSGFFLSYNEINLRNHKKHINLKRNQAWQKTTMKSNKVNLLFREY